MFLKILTHPIFIDLNFHMPMLVDLSHPLIMLTGENGSGKSTLLQALAMAFRGEEADGYVYRLEQGTVTWPQTFWFDAEQHNPRMHLELFENNPEMKEFVSLASHGQIMLSMFQQTFPSLPDRTVLLLDEPEMALSTSNQRRVLKMMQELCERKKFRIVCATHSPIFIDDKATYVINLDNHINRNVLTGDMGVEGASTIQ
jgi:predicted ATPase